ncbi:MAG: hypothetical protein AN484_14040 [Aphanizomenon flos-aquae WA102]|jgi:hypothetical protein|uniref:Uncharacterized protein n=1 Tax=Aphanizomenon flos-aquae WA102 TaxID=1710896 RepID=A0A1B7X176_APHFL|nr:MAG: hypothetical protein AN484_14040 [Aphanizomenon flos-aquae WA102]
MSDTNNLEQQSNLTAFYQTEQICRDNLSHANFNIDSFQQNRQRCSLSSCHGMCCYNGVHVNKETAEVIERLVEEEADFFKGLGLDLPAKVIVDDEDYEDLTVEDKEWQGLFSIKKTAVKKRPIANIVNDYPSHFKNTSCVFLLDDSRCGLQELAKAKGLHPWYYKPFTCWLFPILIAPGENQPEILLPSLETEPWLMPEHNYYGFFAIVLCGKPSDCGQLGSSLLEEELNFLSKIVGRNFVQEIQDSLIRSGEKD